MNRIAFFATLAAPFVALVAPFRRPATLRARIVGYTWDGRTRSAKLDIAIENGRTITATVIPGDDVRAVALGGGAAQWVLP